MKIRLREADKGQFLRVVKTKGARPRDIPITVQHQRELLDELKAWVGAGSLIPSDVLYKTQLGRYEQACIKMGIDKAHGLRHAYAQKRYLELVGFPCPAKGGLKKAECRYHLSETTTNLI